MPGEEQRRATVAGEIQQLEAMLDLVPVGVVIVSPGGHVLRANYAAIRTLGTDTTGEWSRWIGPFQRLDDGSDVPTERPVARALAGETVERERFRRGSQIVELGAAPLFDAAVVTVADVTAEHRREESERDFVANAADQMRTPITIISSVLAALQAGAREEPQTLGRFLAHMDGAVGRLSRVTEALLTLARVQRGVETPARVVILNDVVTRAVDGRDATVDCDREAATVGDDTLLVEALSNVVDNAYTHGAPPVEVACWVDAQASVITVRDHGPGIPAADREAVLRRFHGTGSGLGLSITSEALAACRGTLTLEDAPGGGLLVRFTLPPGRAL